MASRMASVQGAMNTGRKPQGRRYIRYNQARYSSHVDSVASLHPTYCLDEKRRQFPGSPVGIATSRPSWATVHSLTFCDGSR